MDLDKIRVVLFKSLSSGDDVVTSAGKTSFDTFLKDNGYNVLQVDPLSFEFHVDDLVSHVKNYSPYSGWIYVAPPYNVFLEIRKIVTLY